MTFAAALLASVFASASADLAPQPARRICRPGAKSVGADTDKKVLIIGDSMSIGVTGRVSKLLCPKAGPKCLAITKHAPSPGGGGAVDSKYAMDTDVEMTGAGTGPPWIGNLSQAERFGDGCLNGTMLVTSQQEPVQWDVISFNYGVHDVYYGPGMGKGEALVEEWTPFEVYTANLRAIKQTLQRTGAKVIFEASTPIPYNVTTNERIKRYNAAAKEIMAEPPAAAFNDLYKVVTDVCGQPPYNAIAYPDAPNCSIARYNNVHYENAGWDLLASSNAAAIRKLLEEGVSRPRALSKIKASQACSASLSCPADATCMDAQWTGGLGGCCIGYGSKAVQCRDEFHCCPDGWTCSSQCALGRCSCLPPSIV